MSLEKAKHELKAAETAIERMTKAKDFNDYETEWKNFLTALERVWKKTELACKEYRGFQPYQGKYKRLRRQDELLRYLKNARDAEEHTILPTMIKQNEMVQFGLAAGASYGYIEKLRIEDGQVIENISHGIEVRSIPEGMALTQFENRGTTYNIPNIHLGNMIDSDSPEKVALLGLRFYRDFVRRVEQRFC